LMQKRPEWFGVRRAADDTSVDEAS